MNRLLFALALALTACASAPKPDPIAMAEAACKLENDAIIRTGACDDYELAVDCPALIIAEIQCREWRAEAVRQVEK